MLRKSAPLRCSGEHFFLLLGALFCSRERSCAPERFFTASITSPVRLSFGRCQKKSSVAAAAAAWRCFLCNTNESKKIALQAQHEVPISGVNEGGSMAWICDFLVKDIEASMKALKIMRRTVL